MKIVFTSKEDFYKEEIKEHGHDYVEGMLLSGHEAMLVNGVWLWQKAYRTSAKSSPRVLHYLIS